jgi:hypothetical protein
MKLLLLFFLLSFAVNVQAQSLEVFAGVGINGYFDQGYDDGHYRSDYSPGLANCLGIGFFGKTGLGYEMGMTIKHMVINGGVDIAGGGLGAGFGINADTKIRTLELGLFPFTFKSLDDKFEIRLGVEFAYLTNGQVKGKQNSWHLDLDISTTPPRTIYVSESKPINSKSDEYFKDLTASFCVNMGYIISINSKLDLIPKLHFGYGLSKRFSDEIDSTPKNRVAVFEICLRKPFSKAKG